jgi:hypothetical protein
MLLKIEAIAKTEKPPRSSTFPNDIKKFAICDSILETLAAVRGDMGDASQLTRDYLFGNRSFHRDLLALRYYLGETDFRFIRNHMWISPDEIGFTWRDKLNLWLGGDLAE